MNKENTDRIIAACPSIFETMEEQQDNLNSGQIFYPIAFGFECGDGWADLLVELCEKIKIYLDTLPKEVASEIVATQVKEKYGTLRFYLSGYLEPLEVLIQEATRKSASTCEQCGKSGKTRGHHWLYVACDEHTREQDLEESVEDTVS